MQDFSSQPWYSYLTELQQDLVDTSVKLLEREKSFPVESGFVDYSFIIFPMAKAYEGFLKKYFYDFELIDEKTYLGKRFRIGRALNPDISNRHKDEFWIFDDVEMLCGSALARELWETWLECRNRVFHYFPEEKDKITLEGADKKIQKMAITMTNAFQCISQNHI